jgi:hypothetical protein
MQRDESNPTVQKEEERVPFDVVPNPDTRVDQGADEKAVRHSRDSDTDEPVRPRSKDEESGITAVGDDAVNDKEFEVTWDGDDDPMNPRSMPYARKWIIVIIVSASSLCVYVEFSLISLLIFRSLHRNIICLLQFVHAPVWAATSIRMSTSSLTIHVN